MNAADGDALCHPNRRRKSSGPIILLLQNTTLPIVILSQSTFSSHTMSLVRIRLPDLILHCPFELRINPRCRQASLASDKWLHEGRSAIDGNLLDVDGDVKAGLLAAMCYPTVDYGQLRVCCDFLNLLAHFDDMFNYLDFRETIDAVDAVMKILRHPESSYPCTTGIARITHG